MLDNHKQTLRPYCQNHIRSLLQSISYMEDSQKLLKGWLVKPRRHALSLHSPSTFQEELLGSPEHCDLPGIALVFREYFIKKLSYFILNTSLKIF